MGSTRALFASIGVSVSLVAAAALSLFTVSVVIAFGGWSAGLGESTPPAALVIAGATTTASKKDAKHHRAAPVVLPARPQRPRRHAPAAPRRVASKPAPVAKARVVHRPAARAPVAAPAPVQAPSAPAAPSPAPKQTAPTGDAVRRLGDDLNSTAQNAGKALNDATAPLSPPVGAAVEKVLDAVGEVLQRTTNGLGGTLDKLAQKR